MLNNKVFAGGKLNRDDDNHLLPKNDWSDARNVRINSTAYGYLGAFTNIKGMLQRASPTPMGDNDLVIGAEGFDYVNKIFYFTCDPIGNYHRVIQYNADDNTYAVLIENLTDTDNVNVLNFSATRAYRINHIDLIDGKYLYWTDNLNPPRMLDITKDYGIITEQSISAIKYAPTQPPTNLVVIDDCTINSNKIKDNNYQFRYRWIYWDNSRSVFSPISNISNQKGRASGVLSYGLQDWYESALKFNFEGGGSLVKGYEIIARENNTGDWVVIDSSEYSLASSRIGYGVKFIFTSGSNTYNISVTYNGTTYDFGATYTPFGVTNLYQIVYDNFVALGLTNLSIERSESSGISSQEQFLYITSKEKNVDFSIQTSSPNLTAITQNGFLKGNDINNTYVFSSLQVVSAIDQSEANKPYDYVPLKAASQCTPNGNYLAYGDYTEGYDNVDIDASATVYTQGIVYAPQFSVVASDLGSGTTHFEFDGFYGGGEMSFIVTKYNPETSQYTFSVKSNIQNETKEQFIARVAFMFSTYYEGSSNVVNIDSTGFDILGGVGANQKRFLTTILSTDTRQKLKAGDEYQYGVVYIDAAGRYGSVNTSDSMLVKTEPLDTYKGLGNKYIGGLVTIRSRPPLWATRYAIVRTKRKKKDFFIQMFVDNITFRPVTALIDLQTSINKYNERYGTDINYSWVKGDRIQFIYENNIVSGNTVVYDTEITGIDDLENLIVPSSGVPGISVGADNGFVEIYREAISSSATLFWEIAEFGEVGNVGEANAYHIKIYDDGSNQSQNASDPVGIPLIHYSKTGDIWFKQRFLPVPVPQEPTYGFYTRVWCESPSFSDFNCDVFTSDVGRANVQNAFAKQTRYLASIRHSGVYQSGTAINNLSAFAEDSFIDCSIQYGPIQKLVVNGSTLIIGQKLRLSRSYIFQSLILDKASDQTFAVSEKLMSNNTYYDYEAGIGDAPEAAVLNGSKFYFVDKIRGLVCRLAENGVTPISITAKMNSYFRAFLADAIAIAGGFDPENNEYLISILGEDTIVYSENSDGFTSFMDFLPTYYATLGKSMYSFEQLRLFKHNATNNYNNFYDNPYPSILEFIDNENPLQVKSYLSLSETANDLWLAPTIATELGQSSNLVLSDFQDEDGLFTSFEGGYFAGFLGDTSSPGGIINGDTLKGKWIKVRLQNSNTNFVYLLSVGVKQIPSLQGNI